MPAFKIDTKPAFLDDLFELPKAAQTKVKLALGRIREDPFTAEGHAKKVFKHQYKNVYRYRIGDYRILYCVGEGCVAMLGVGPRGDIYERFTVRPEDLNVTAMPDVEPIAIPPAPGVQPNVEDVPEAPEPIEDEEPLPAPDRTPGFFRQLLAQWEVPANKHDAILACKQIEDIIDLGLGDTLTERILHWNSPPTINEIAEQPTLDVPSLEDLDRYLEGTLSGFLLKLDPEQQRVANRTARGAQLVKGGPGSGKSIVAMYYVRHRIIDAIPGSPKVLFVTFGRTLTGYSRQLLDGLLGDRASQVRVDNLDAVARSIVVGAGEPYHSADQAQKVAALRAALEIPETPFEPAASIALKAMDEAYLLDEIEWVIEGRRIPDLAAYLMEERAGRRVRLDGRIRRAIWQLSRSFENRLAKQKVATHNSLRAEAIRILEHSSPEARYDVVVVDEGQDLPPVALALCAELCRTPDGLYVTADANQSIYGRGFGWIRAHGSLDFRGRTTVLRRNYRSTKQIAAAAVDLLSGPDTDPDGLVSRAVREGPLPVLARCATPADHGVTIGSYLLRMAEAIRMPVSSAGILVRTQNDGNAIVKALNNQGIDARFVRAGDLDLKAPYVKVLTMHSAKGLEFPITVVYRADRGVLPFNVGLKDSDALAEHAASERRLLFVALTRAMRRLMVTTTVGKESPFLAETDSALWAEITA